MPAIDVRKTGLLVMSSSFKTIHSSLVTAPGIIKGAKLQDSQKMDCPLGGWLLWTDLCGGRSIHSR